MNDGLFSGIHLLMLILSAAIMFGGPFLAGFFLGRYVELKKSKGRERGAAGGTK